MSGWDSYDWRPGGEPPLAPGLEPRWGPDRPLAERITRVGRFGAIDPSTAGRVWTRWNWFGFTLWVGVLGGTLARAHRQHGDLRPPRS